MEGNSEALWRGLLFILCSCRGGGSEGLVSPKHCLERFFFLFTLSLLVDIYFMGERQRLGIGFTFFSFPPPHSRMVRGSVLEVFALQ